MAVCKIVITAIRSHLYWIVAAICYGAAISGCAPSVLTPAAAAPRVASIQFAATPCRFAIPTEQPVTCGDLSVPEDYEREHGRQLHLHVAILKSSGDVPAQEPLLSIWGGPGAYALDRLDNIAQRFAAVLATRDVILFDQRGVGYSQPSLNCPELDEFSLVVIDQQLNSEETFTHRLAIYQQCRERLEAKGISLDSYSAAAIAADIASLRQALGYEKWHVYGVSYGARLALLLMRDYPEGISSVVLDSVYPLEIDLAEETAVMYTHALHTLFAAVAPTHPAFKETFFALVDELNASPITVPVSDPRNRDWFYLQSFTGTDLLQLTINLVRWPQSFPHIPGLVAEIARGQYGDLSLFLQPAVGDQLFSEGMNLSVNCQEIDPRPPQLQQDTANPIEPQIVELAAADVQQRLALCATWLGADWPVRRQTGVVQHTPALVLMGEQDTIIPPHWPEQVMTRLTGSTLLTFPKSGHNVLINNDCASQVIAAFLINPTQFSANSCQ